MKIVYGILCHTDPKHIARLADKLTENTENIVLIHVDKKCDDHEFVELIQNDSVRFIKERTKISWGGYSSVEATISLMNEALECAEFDRFVLLQGLEYPIKSNIEIDEYFARNPDAEFIKAQNISGVKDIKEAHKYRFYYYLDKGDSFFAKVLHYSNHLMVKNNILVKFKQNYAADENGKHYEIYQGAAQFGLTYDAVRYIVDFNKTNPKFNSYFRSMYAPDESYFHTVIYNSPFACKTPLGRAEDNSKGTLHITKLENLSYFEYPNEIRIFTKVDEWPLLENSGMLYFRKATSESIQLLDYIDEIHSRNSERDL